MSQPGEVSKFTGEESAEEAERWLETFVNSTGSFSDSGIFRLLGRKLPAGSVARQWFDSLEENVKTSWGVFEREFCSRWIFTAGRLDKQTAWEAFTRHFLSDNAIFSGKEFDNVYTSGIISEWVEEHLRLGKETGAEDSDLLETTKHLLPSFIQAYFQVYIHTNFQHFGQLCASIISIPSQIFHLEFTRRQLSPEDRILGVERRIEVISEKMDKLMNLMGGGGINLNAGSVPAGTTQDASGEQHPEIRNISLNESIIWEQCSPLTSDASMPDPPSTNHSQLSTPAAQSTPLQNILEDQSLSAIFEEANDSATVIGNLTLSEDSAFCVPCEWRKPLRTRTKAELIEIARQAIEVDAHFQYGPPVKYVQYLVSECAQVIYQRLTSSLPKQPCQWLIVGNDSMYDPLLSALRSIHSSAKDKTSSPQITTSISHWYSYIGSDSTSLGIFITLDQTRFQWQDMNVEMNMKAAGDASTSGGIYTYDYSGRRILSSIKTVLYMALSSYLAELTRQSRFLEVAIQCANCIKVWMLDPTTSLIKDCSIDVQVGQELSGAALSCHLTGFAIEGLSVLGSVTGNQEWNNLAIDISRAAMKHREWHSNDGVIIVGTDGTASENTNIKAMKGLLNIGLMVVYERNRTNEPFCNLVRSYINVQFNALYDLARSQNTYGVDWRGPFVGPYPHAQIAAVDTLVAAIGVND